MGRVQKRTPPLPTATDFQTDQNANKGFQQQPMCQNPLFSAVFPIFCSFPLYQLSGLHFSIFVERCRIFRNRFLLCRFVKSCIFRNRYPLDKFLYQLSGLHFLILNEKSFRRLLSPCKILSSPPRFSGLTQINVFTLSCFFQNIFYLDRNQCSPHTPINASKVPTMFSRPYPHSLLG